MAAVQRVYEPEPEAETDEQLIARVVGGERDAFDQLYDRYFPRVFGFVKRRLSNRADVEETVQEVFIAVFSSLESYRGDAPFGAWVLGVSRRTVASRFKRKRHPTVPFEDHSEAETLEVSMPMFRRQATPLEIYEYEERAGEIERIVSQEMSAEQRRMFEMHHLDHLPIQEIARSVHKSEDAVKSNLYRARKLLLAR